MKSLRSSVIFASLPVWVSACAGTGDAFTIDPVEFDRTAGTIALVPVVVGADIEVPESVLTHIDSLIESYLKDEGIPYVPSWEYSAAWNRIVDLMGGLSDSTGQWVETKLEIAREQLIRDLGDSHEFGSLLFPEIWMVEANVTDGVAKWDGASEAMVSFGARLLDAFLTALNGTGSDLPQGSVPALSLGVIVESVDGAQLYSHAGGIQVLERIGRKPEDRRPVEPAEWFHDEGRLRQAVRTALGPLTERSRNVP